MREAVADFYNATYRRGKKSQYTADNVSIASGGRLALTRLASALGNINMGHFIPDYTAYEELLSVFKAFTPIPILLEAKNGYKISPTDLKEEILGRGLSALLVSNPCNPTGQLMEGKELSAWCDLARECQCSMIFDEFYSHYIYEKSQIENRKSKIPQMVSAAEFVDDVDKDPIVIVDGLTKNWRYPGWRISWTLGRKPSSRRLPAPVHFWTAARTIRSKTPRFHCLIQKTPSPKHWRFKNILAKNARCFCRG